MLNLYFVKLQGPYEYNAITLPQAEIPSFIPINDKFKITVTEKGKLNNKLCMYIQTTIDWELKEVD